jgi:hypothetical protein
MDGSVEMVRQLLRRRERILRAEELNPWMGDDPELPGEKASLPSARETTSTSTSVSTSGRLPRLYDN